MAVSVRVVCYVCWLVLFVVFLDCSGVGELDMFCLVVGSADISLDGC